MTFSDALKGYESFARRLAIQAGTRVDGWIGARRIRTERSDVVLGAEAIPAPVYGYARIRR